MSNILLDTNILLRFCNPTSPQHLEVEHALAHLRLQGHIPCLTTQNIVEFWAVATRPSEVNGLGRDTTKTQQRVEQLLNQFFLLEDTPAIFARWWELVATHEIKGKKVHDTRLVAVMQAHGVTHLLTFNTDDFKAFPNITRLHPKDIS